MVLLTLAYTYNTKVSVTKVRTAVLRSEDGCVERPANMADICNSYI